MNPAHSRKEHANNLNDVEKSMLSETLYLSHSKHAWTSSEPIERQSSVNATTVCINSSYSFRNSTGIAAGCAATSSQNMDLDRGEAEEAESLLDYYLELDSDSSPWSTHRSIFPDSDVNPYSEVDHETQPQTQQPASKPTMERSKFSIISSSPLRRHSTGKTVVGQNHPVLRALEEEARQLRCGQPCRGCKCLSLETVRDPEFCSDLTVCLSAVCCPFSGFH